MTAQQKTWTKESVLDLIETSNLALARAVIQIYERQTADEKSTEATREHNGRGFNSRDAQFLSSIAKALPRYDMRMTERQLASVRPMMRKYWRQLLEVIEERGGAVAYPRAKKSIREVADMDSYHDELPDCIIGEAETQARPKAMETAPSWGMF